MSKRVQTLGNLFKFCLLYRANQHKGSLVPKALPPPHLFNLCNIEKLHTSKAWEPQQPYFIIKPAEGRLHVRLSGGHNYYEH